MIIGAELVLKYQDCDDNVLNFKEGDTLRIKKRDYQKEDGYEVIEGRLDSILPMTSELRIDTSTNNNGTYVVLGFGQIIGIELIPGEDTVYNDDDVAIFDVRTKKIINETIPDLLNRILGKVIDINLRCESCCKNENLEDDNNEDDNNEDEGSSDTIGAGDQDDESNG